MGSATEIARELVAEIQKDDILGLAAELAYRFLFALFPLLIFVAALGGLTSGILGVDDPADRAMEMLGDALPEGAEETVTSQLSRVLEQQNPGLLSVGLVLALWVASGGLKAVMKATNRAYEVDEARPFLRKNAVALGLTVLLGAAVIGGLVLLMVGQFFAGEIADRLGLGAWTAMLIQAGQILGAALLLFVAVAFLYWAAPNATVPVRWIVPGAVGFVVTWIVATVGFGFYVGNFGAYANTYGALGGVIVLMLWFYITGLVLLAGAELNIVLMRRYAPEALANTNIVMDGRNGDHPGRNDGYEESESPGTDTVDTARTGRDAAQAERRT